MADNKKKNGAPKAKGEGAKAMPKSAVYKELATKTGLEAKQVSAVFEALEDLVKGQLGKKGAGLFAIPNMVKFKRVVRPATKETTRENPFKKGEMMVVKAKPASVKVKAIILKGLKDIGK
jgi:hypothetical protein